MDIYLKEMMAGDPIVVFGTTGINVKRMFPIDLTERGKHFVLFVDVQKALRGARDAMTASPMKICMPSIPSCQQYPLITTGIAQPLFDGNY